MRASAVVKRQVDARLVSVATGLHIGNVQSRLLRRFKTKYSANSNPEQSISTTTLQRLK
jgi:hypothetical protein